MIGLRKADGEDQNTLYSTLPPPIIPGNFLPDTLSPIIGVRQWHSIRRCPCTQAQQSHVVLTGLCGGDVRPPAPEAVNLLRCRRVIRPSYSAADVVGPGICASSWDRFSRDSGLKIKNRFVRLAVYGLIRFRRRTHQAAFGSLAPRLFDSTPQRWQRQRQRQWSREMSRSHRRRRRRRNRRRVIIIREKKN